RLWELGRSKLIPECRNLRLDLPQPPQPGMLGYKLQEQLTDRAMLRCLQCRDLLNRTCPRLAPRRRSLRQSPTLRCRVPLVIGRRLRRLVIDDSAAFDIHPLAQVVEISRDWLVTSRAIRQRRLLDAY